MSRMDVFMPYTQVYPVYHEVIEPEIQIGKLPLSPDDYNKTLSYQAYEEIVEKILRIVTKDSSTDAAKRFITTGRKVFGFKRNKVESCAYFV